VSADRGEALARTERDILAEKAATLGRAGERLEQALAEVAAIGCRLDAGTDPAEGARLAREYEAAWSRAAAARLTLLIQRESIGLRYHRVVEQQFPEPPRLTRRRHIDPRLRAASRSEGQASDAPRAEPRP
jgi:hypothetical protein